LGWSFLIIIFIVDSKFTKRLDSWISSRSWRRFYYYNMWFYLLL